MVRPIGDSMRFTHSRSRKASAPGPVTSKSANGDASTMPARSRSARCSARVIGDHQRASHSCGRSRIRSP